MRRLLGGKVQRDLIGDADAVAFEGHDLLRMVCYHADIFQSQIDQNLGADAAFVLNHSLTRRLAIQLAARMKMDLRQLARRLCILDCESASGVVKVQKYASPFLGNS